MAFAGPSSVFAAPLNHFTIPLLRLLRLFTGGRFFPPPSSRFAPALNHFTICSLDRLLRLLTGGGFTPGPSSRFAPALNHFSIPLELLATREMCCCCKCSFAWTSWFMTIARSRLRRVLSGAVVSSESWRSAERRDIDVIMRVVTAPSTHTHTRCYGLYLAKTYLLVAIGTVRTAGVVKRGKMLHTPPPTRPRPIVLRPVCTARA